MAIIFSFFNLSTWAFRGFPHLDCQQVYAKYQETERLVTEAIAVSEVEATIDKVTNSNVIAGFTVFPKTAIIIGEQVKFVGASFMAHSLVVIY